tara:strand:+ start:610 stop:1110 length:501 start_codon:yes stop_codon:yes gene_type:complete
MLETQIVSKSWFTGGGTSRTFDQVVDDSQTELIIGTDSHRSGRKGRVFATAICLPNDTEGHRYFWSRCTVSRKDVPNIFTQIYMETLQSIEVAEALCKRGMLIPSDITIHIDCSPEGSVYKSSMAAKTVFNLVRSYGFGAIIKPEIITTVEEFPWAASGIADKHAR